MAAFGYIEVMFEYAASIQKIVYTHFKFYLI